MKKLQAKPHAARRRPGRELTDARLLTGSFPPGSGLRRFCAAAGLRCFLPPLGAALDLGACRSAGVERWGRALDSVFLTASPRPVVTYITRKENEVQ